ncbi:sel1 repeat family protein [Bradyrhizobium elkanii]|uniref:sel1 repeat family protein n=1 Tax=Bradyrhizobium elkanii TaxID=29448 RepID=UPI0004ADFC36|nr:sel1 repeat family protein [Bradyrhizobium elkanii]WLA78820.1 sel1 repeat family protein [Bradyrhizobium elkanii]
MGDDVRYRRGRQTAIVEAQSRLTGGGVLCAFLLVLSVLTTMGLYSEAKTIFQQIQAGVAMIAAILLFGLGVAVLRKHTYRVFEIVAVEEPSSSLLASSSHNYSPTDGAFKFAAGAAVVAIVGGIYVLAYTRIGSSVDSGREEIKNTVATTAASADAKAMEDAHAAYNRGDYTTAVTMYRDLAVRGNAKAQLSVGLMYLGGQGVSKDWAIAQQWLKSASINPAADQATRAEATAGLQAVDKMSGVR